MALIASRLQWIWIGSVCVRMRTDFSYSNNLGWNTFPFPKLTEKNFADLTAAAEGILLAREALFPATIADLYDPEKMPANLRAAMTTTTRFWNASTSTAASATTPNGWKSCSRCTRR